jgi:hypothetical protein
MTGLRGVAIGVLVALSAAVWVYRSSGPGSGAQRGRGPEADRAEHVLLKPEPFAVAPESHFGGEMVCIASFSSRDRRAARRIRALFEREGVRPYMLSGSLGTDVSVLRADAVRAVEALRRDAETHRYRVEIHNPEAPSSGATRSDWQGSTGGTRRRPGVLCGPRFPGGAVPGRTHSG